MVEILKLAEYKKKSLETKLKKGIGNQTDRPQNNNRIINQTLHYQKQNRFKQTFKMIFIFVKI